MPLSLPSSSDRSPDTLVENRTCFGGKDVTFSIYDTYQAADQVALRSPHPMYCGMVTGKKIMHVGNQDPFPFLPGESLMVPALEELHIDFPEAGPKTPTTCITLEIDRQKVQQFVDRINEARPQPPASDTWTMEDLQYVHFEHCDGLENVVQSLVQLFSEDHPYKDALIDLNAAELVLRMLQTRSRSLLLDDADLHASRNGLAAAVQHVHRHLDRQITMDELADKACMSTSTFYRHFRTEFGVTPLQYVTAQRLERACHLLQDERMTVTDVSYELGFGSISYFIDVFKKHMDMTPKQYQHRHLKTETEEA